MTAKGNLSAEDLCFTPAVELREMLREKAISPTELIQVFLERIGKINPAINAYGTLVPEMAPVSYTHLTLPTTPYV